MIWYKQGVWGELIPEAAEALRKTAKLYYQRGEDLFVTSIRDSTHSAGSYHTTGRAWDQRSGKVSLVEHAKALGPDFDVIDESNHRHIEYDPKPH